MEDGLERNFTWIKIQHHQSSFSKENEPLDSNDREKKAIENEDVKYNNVKILMQKIRKNKID